jgi:uncharacterized protein DUF6204
MSERTYRVIVRGYFTNLDEAQRAALLDVVDEHDLLSAAFTDEGTLIYDRALRNFTVRCVVRQSSEARPGVDDEEAVAQGCDRATAILAARGLEHGPLRATATCLEDIKIKRRPARR